MRSQPKLSNPKAIAEKGEAIYLSKYKDEYERIHDGQFVAIDVLTEKAFVGPTPEGVLEEAEKVEPHGIFHLVQVGYPSAFRVSYTSHESLDWVFR